MTGSLPSEKWSTMQFFYSYPAWNKPLGSAKQLHFIALLVLWSVEKCLHSWGRDRPSVNAAILAAPIVADRQLRVGPSGTRSGTGPENWFASGAPPTNPEGR